MKKQSSGLYRTSVTVGHDESGKPILKYISAHTMAALEKRKQEIRRQYISGSEADVEKLVYVAAQEWFLTAKDGHISASGRNRYVSIINNYIVPAIGSRRVTSVTRQECQSILNKFADKSVSYIKTAKTTLYGIFQLCVDDGIIVRNPAANLQPPRYTPPAEKRIFTPYERQVLTAYAKKDLRIALLYYTGMRSGEIRALRWQDVDLQRGVIHVRRALAQHPDDFTNCKNATSRRTVPIAPQLLAILAKSRGLPNAPVLGEYYSIHQFCHAVLNILRDLGIQNASAHCFRHNFISMCWENGMDFMLTSKIVGHANPTITLDVYTHLDEARASEKASALLARMF